MTRKGAPAGSLHAAVPVLWVSSVARSIRWYAEILGFVPDAVGPPEDPVFAILRRDGAELMLQKVIPGVGEPRSAGHGGGGWDVYLRVDDAHALWSAIRRSVPGLGPIEVRPYGCREFTLADPDGHAIVLGECG